MIYDKERYMNEKFDLMLFGPMYYDTKDLRYNNVYKFFLSNQQLIEYKQYKKQLIQNRDKKIVTVDLKSFNSDYIFFVNGQCLLNLQLTYLRMMQDDFQNFQSTVVQRNLYDILWARVYSELEGSMNLENVPTTRTRLEQIKKGSEPRDKNEIIAKNMLDAIEFILSKPKFNKENLYELYSILSHDCLEDNQKLNGNFYRNDSVYIGDYEGCSFEKIDECMDSLFAFVGNNLNNKASDVKEYLAHICHYYILYIHPYFDYNGRTARMVSFWISILQDDFSTAPLFISEAINDDKKRYYDALSETRDMENDMTYFLIYIMNTSIRYSLLYKNLNYISDKMLKKGITLTNYEKAYIKKILLGAEEGYFDYKKFLAIANIDISKQAAFKALNKLVEYGILSSMINDKKVKLFKLNNEFVKYRCVKDVK